MIILFVLIIEVILLVQVTVKMISKIFILKKIHILVVQNENIYCILIVPIINNYKTVVTINV